MDTLKGVTEEPQTGRNSVYAGLFYLLTAIQLLPLALFRYFPSQDGPSHLFNSYVFVSYSHVPAFREAFTRQVPTAGNLAGHGIAILLMWLGVPYETCEKLIVALCIVGLALAFRYAVSEVESAPRFAAFLIFPLVYNWPLQMGFWSFSLGVPFLLVCLGLCLRYRGSWSVRSTGLLLLTVAAAYLSHPIDWAVCGLGVALMTVSAQWKSLWRSADRTRTVWQTLIPILVFVPFAIPNFLFAEQNQLVEWDQIRSLRKMLWPIYTAGPLHLSVEDWIAAKLLFVLLASISLVNIAFRARKRQFSYLDTLAVVATALFLVGLLSPARIGEGTYLEVRFLLFGYLVWALWLAVTLDRRQLAVVAPVAVAVSLWLMIARVPAWRAADKVLDEVVKAGQTIQPNSTVCQMDFTDSAQPVAPLTHAVDLLSDKNPIDVRDYEAGRRAFWTRFRPGYFFDENYMAMASTRDFEGALQRFKQRTGKDLDYIVLTGLQTSPEQKLHQLLPSLADSYVFCQTGTPDVAVYRAHH